MFIRKGIFTIFILIFLLHTVTADYYRIDTTFYQGKIHNITVRESHGNAPFQPTIKRGAFLELFDHLGNVLHSQFIQSSIEVITHGEDFDISDYHTEIIYTKTYPAISSLLITDEYGNQMNYDMSAYTTCNFNTVCETFENGITCINDCGFQDEDNVCTFLEDGICEEDPDCEHVDIDCIKIQNEKQNQNNAQNEDEDNKNIANPSNTSQKNDISISRYIFIIVILFTLLLIVVFLILKRRRGRIKLNI